MCFVVDFAVSWLEAHRASEGGHLVNSTTYQWSHRTGGFVTVAESTRLTICTLEEFSYCYFHKLICISKLNMLSYIM